MLETQRLKLFNTFLEHTSSRNILFLDILHTHLAFIDALKLLFRRLFRVNREDVTVSGRYSRVTAVEQL